MIEKTKQGGKNMVLIYQVSGVTSGSKVISAAAAGASQSSDKVGRENFVKQIFELWNKEDFDAAKDLAAERSKTNPNDALTHYILGKSYRLLRSAEFATLDLAEFQKAAQLEPKNELYQVEAVVVEASIKRQDAIRLGQIISQLSALPETPLKLAALAFVSSLKDVVGGSSPQNKKNNFQMIEQRYLKRAVELLKNPSPDRWYDGSAYLLICDTYVQSAVPADLPRDWRKMTEWLRYKTAELGMPLAVLTYYNLQITNLISDNKVDEALAAAEVALDKNCWAVFNNYIWVVGKTPNPRVLESKVKTYYQKVSTGEPNNLKHCMNMANFLLLLANNCYKVRNVEDGNNYAKEAEKILLNAGEILKKEPMNEKLYRKYGRVDLVEVYYNLGQVYEAMGSRDLAKKYYQDALDRPGSEQSPYKRFITEKLKNF